jgi:hypothetical protein
MNNELVENIEKTNVKYLLGDEENEKLGVQSSGKISGSAAFLYNDQKSIESIISVDHFSCDISASETPKEGVKALELEMRKIRMLYKDTAWSRVISLANSKLIRGNEGNITDFILAPLNFL